MRSKIKVLGVALVALLGLVGLTACGTNPVAGFDASSVNCNKVASAIKSAQADLRSANSHLASYKGTPGEVSAKSDVSVASNKVDALTERQTECESSTTATIDKNLEECRVSAVKAYMAQQGFKATEFTVGEENLDRSYTELHAAGSAKFWDTIDSRKKLQELFRSTDPGAIAAVNRVLEKVDATRGVALDIDNWEVVQASVATEISGNHGIVNGKAVNFGTRNSAPGDAVWLFIDTDSCQVATAKSTEAGNPPEVIIIRVGCSNPGENLWPKDPSQDPAVKGKAPVGGGTNVDPGPGTYIPPAQMDQPPATPREDPAPLPAPSTPPVGSTPDPAPAPAPEQPGQPVNQPGDACAPGIPSC